ncbi:class I SAM-dependent methyltransferase [Pseudonocardia sp. KRD291]|uniref:class I SAM-dependent methyltransferase n=1 Tax=Pseudonocardia sp. KRD291 TaxID=2792007 RepID=UPI001C4A4E32|nr:class I SAM-dependent methyltransferase [Pseudonocardia sp. KRD291]MBW0106861.1 class I SAM-dependent methyltransferase [Pseudonocardia sp. KRD291]
MSPSERDLDESPSRTTASYEGAAQHYLSPQRRDPVKVSSEEPISRRIIARALSWLDLPDDGPVRVLDVGSGTADGFALLTAPGADGVVVLPESRCRYVGLDVDPEMVATAAAHTTSPRAEFVLGDVRDELPGGAFDLYLSCGVPYSHLTADELADALASVLGSITARRRRAVVVVDVLGRYSVEWQPRWHLERWDYAMSFFAGGEHIEEPMTFHDRPSLDRVVDRAAAATGARITRRAHTDRSVLVGRHTATGTFHPEVPRFRSLVNALVRDPDGVRAEQLRFTPALEGAPAEVLAHLAGFAERWNATLKPFTGRALSERDAGRLADGLLARERAAADAGLGVGHSFTATLLVEP